MNWERDALWAKAKYYFEIAATVVEDDLKYGVWCSLGLELLARSVIASWSPILLASRKDNLESVLYSIGLSNSANAKSIDIKDVFRLCGRIHEPFQREQHQEFCNKMFDWRNAEFHSGAAAFATNPSSEWVIRFLRACNSLAEAQDETLESLFGENLASDYKEMMYCASKELTDAVNRKIGLCHRNFKRLSPDEQRQLIEKSVVEAEEMAGERRHDVECPACGGRALLSGRPFGKAHQIWDEDSDVFVVHMGIAPRRLKCNACGLDLTNYQELEAAKCAVHWTRKSELTPEEFHGLYNEDDLNTLVAERGWEAQDEYDNE